VQQHHRLTKSYFDTISERYDGATTRPETHWLAPQVVRSLLPRGIKHKKSGAVLDIGIGTGQAASYFYDQGWQITGIDLSPKMVSIARRKLPKAKLYTGNVELNPPLLRRQSFDLVLAVGVFEFIGNVGQVISWIEERLKPGGYLCFTYEELLPRSKLQRWKVAELGKGIVSPVPKQLKMLVYRRTLTVIRQFLARCRLQIRVQKRFAAYLKRGHYPVYYRAVIAQKHNQPKSDRV